MRNDFVQTILNKNENKSLRLIKPAYVEMTSSLKERSDTKIIHMWYESPMATQGAKAYNPSFDITQHWYITAFITEYGIVTPPFIKKLCDI